MWSRRLALVGLTAAMLTAPVRAQQQPLLQAATIVERPGNHLPRDLRFVDSNGHATTLGSLLNGKPIVLMLAYFSCPMLCPYEQQGAADAFASSGWHLGRDFRAITVSIDPRDTPATAREWRDRSAARMRLDPASFDWHYLTGGAEESRALADAVGYHYGYDARTGQFSHAAALFIITADGRVARYLYGINYEPKTLVSALVEARENGVGGPVQRFLLRCYHYVPSLRQHAGFVAWLLRLGGLFVVGAIAAMLVVLWRRDTRRMAELEATDR